LGFLFRQNNDFNFYFFDNKKISIKFLMLQRFPDIPSMTPALYAIIMYVWERSKTEI